MRCGRWISAMAALAIAGGLAGCKNEEPRELGRGGGEALPGQVEQGQGDVIGREDKIDEASASHQLDGKTFTVQLRGPEGKMVEDQLSFRDGKFDSSACHEHGYSAAPYTALEGPDGLTFRSITSSGEGRMRWNGTVMGDRIEGTAVVDQPGKDPVYYSYQGSSMNASRTGSLGGQGSLEGEAK